MIKYYKIICLLSNSVCIGNAVESKSDDEKVTARIAKDIMLFSKSIDKIDKLKLNKSERYIVELSEMYARDAQSYLDKKDLCTAFSCISYAHGLLDAIKHLSGVDIGSNI